MLLHGCDFDTLGAGSQCYPGKHIDLHLTAVLFYRSELELIVALFFTVLDAPLSLVFSWYAAWLSTTGQLAAFSSLRALS